jgi:hypothetical protein
LKVEPRKAKPKEPRERREHKEPREHKPPREQKEPREHKAPREHKERRAKEKEIKEFGGFEGEIVSTKTEIGPKGETIHTQEVVQKRVYSKQEQRAREKEKQLLSMFGVKQGKAPSQSLHTFHTLHTLHTLRTLQRGRGADIAKDKSKL